MTIGYLTHIITCLEKGGYKLTEIKTIGMMIFLKVLAKKSSNWAFTKL